MNLQLSLKTKWFEMTKTGIKTEDYREITPYWQRRLYHCTNDENKEAQCVIFQLDKEHIHNCKDCIVGLSYFKKFTTNTVTLGYPKSGDTERIIKLEHKGIEIRTGNPEWGAEPDKLYFVILHGAILE